MERHTRDPSRNLRLDRVKVHRTFEVIVEQLKDQVFAGAYQPGDRLPSERDLATMLGVGRSAVREAYRALELIGIVSIRKGKHGGAFINERNHQSLTETLSDLIRLRRINIADLTEARLVLEKDVTELAMRRVGAEEIAQLRASVEAAIRQANCGVAATAENLQFHMLLGKFSGNPILSMMLASTLDLLQIVIGAVAPTPEVSRANAEEHYGIIDALQSGDLMRLHSILEDHIRHANDELLRLTTESRLYAAARASEKWVTGASHPTSGRDLT